MSVVVTHPTKRAVQYEFTDEEYATIYGRTSVMLAWKGLDAEGHVAEQRRLARENIVLTNKGAGIMKCECYARRDGKGFPQESFVEDASTLVLNDTARMFTVAIDGDSIVLNGQSYAFPKGSKLSLDMDGSVYVNGVEAVAPLIGKGIRINRTPGQIGHQALQKKLGKVALLGPAEMHPAEAFEVWVQILGKSPGVTSASNKAKDAWDSMFAED